MKKMQFWGFAIIQLWCRSISEFEFATRGKSLSTQDFSAKGKREIDKGTHYFELVLSRLQKREFLLVSQWRGSRLFIIQGVNYEGRRSRRPNQKNVSLHSTTILEYQKRNRIQESPSEVPCRWKDRLTIVPTATNVKAVNSSEVMKTKSKC